MIQARADIYADYSLPWMTSYTTRVKENINNMDSYLNKLRKDQEIPMNQKKAVFIVNSDNLAQVLDKLKQQLQFNIVGETSFLTEDNKFYQIRGDLIDMRNFLKGIDHDFRNKITDKSAYNENYKPLLE